MATKTSLLFVLVSGLIISLVSVGQAQVSSFVSYHTASADLTWRYLTGDEEQVVTGVFTVTLPDKFSLRVTAPASQWQRVNGYHELTEVITTSGHVEYKYEPVQPFSVFQALFGQLIEANTKAVTYLGDEMVGGRAVSRYQCLELSTYWFDRETNIPLRITDESGTNILSLRQYQVDAEHKQGVEFFTLAVKQENWEGTIRIGKADGNWFPRELEVSDDQSRIILTFANWRVNEQPLNLNGLEQLDHVLVQGQLAVEQGEHDQIIKYYRQLLNIDPYYTPAYVNLARSYGAVGNYLGAVESYQQWLMLEPDHPAALNNLAYTYMLNKTNMTEAINLAYKAVTLDPQASFLDTLGYGYYLVHDYDKALHYLLQASENADERELPEIYQHLILVYQALGNQAEVELYEQRLLELAVGEQND